MISNLIKAGGNPHHDMVNGQFTHGSGSRTLDRAEQERAQEQQQARTERSERHQSASGQLILSEQQARQRGESTSDLLDVHDAKDMENASKETGGSRVFNFSQGEGGDLDQNVRFVTNTNAQGKFERGILRVEIHSPTQRNLYQRPMSDLPRLVAQVLAKKYGAVSQHRRNTQHNMKAEGEGNPNHDERGRFASGDTVYHGTNKDFYEFDTSYQHGSGDFGAGIYVTPRKELAGLYGKNVISAISGATHSLRMDEFTLDDAKRIASAAGKDISDSSTEGTLGDIVATSISDESKAFSNLRKFLGTNDTTPILQRAGYDSVVSPQGSEMVIFDSKHLGYPKSSLMKSDAPKFVTIGGHVVPIGDKEGGQNKPDTAQPTAQPEVQSDKGAEISQAEREQLVGQLADKLKAAGSAVTVTLSQTDKEDANGKVAAELDNNAKTLTFYPESFSRGMDEFKGTAAHEISHLKFNAVLDKYRSEKEKFDSGTSRLDLPVFNDLQPVFTPNNRSTYQNAGAVTPYTKVFLYKYQAEPTTTNYVNFISESLAETSRLILMGQGESVGSQWMNLHSRVNRAYKGK